MKELKTVLLVFAAILVLLEVGCSEERSTMEQTGQIPRRQTESGSRAPTVPGVADQSSPAPKQQAGPSPTEPVPPGQYPRGQERSTPRMQCEEQFAAMDVNSNGKVSRDEFMAFSHRVASDLEATFKSMDTDGDTILTNDEFCAKGGLK